MAGSRLRDRAYSAHRPFRLEKVWMTGMENVPNVCGSGMDLVTFISGGPDKAYLKFVREWTGLFVEVRGVGAHPAAREPLHFGLRVRAEDPDELVQRARTLLEDLLATVRFACMQHVHAVAARNSLGHSGDSAGRPSNTLQHSLRP
ncbi:hypothetical protein FVE85_8018 [Porphyridium purpureum]|uniref:Uncharacterized protein n=1 Tax=Porphyridium purpureum TaxID=35688 RepID=A0A5J4YM00_PORPP|nr:hypothetical protein FVE85_8018 [Porphyridium purpureum]|eukprot:POR6452..scf295_9